MNYSCSFVLALGDDDAGKTVSLAAALRQHGFPANLDQDISCLGRVFEGESISVILDDLNEIMRLLEFLEDVKALMEEDDAV